MLQGDLSLVAMASALGQSQDYRVLRRLIPRSITISPADQAVKTGILLDVETTGLDLQKDEVIELGMVKFDYVADGRIVGLRDEMVAGHRIDAAAVESFVQDSVIVIAHNAAFDRKFAERLWAVFEHKAWGCSATEVEWRRHGFAGAQLGYLLNGAGFFHHAHRAGDDCHALVEILSVELPSAGAPALAVLLEQARKKTVRVWAEQSPFDLKDVLKRRGYRWSDGSDGRPRSWYVDVSEADVDVEIAFLKSEIYLREITPRLQTLTAFTRFSART